jgi:PAS domain S-box-containing protein
VTEEKNNDAPASEAGWDYWEQLIESTSDPIAIVDANHVILHFNQPFRLLAPEFNSGRQFRDLILPEHQRSWDECVRGSSRNQVVSLHLAVRTGELTRWLAIRILPIFDGGKLSKFFVVCIDVTDTINFETELRKRERLLQKAEQLGGVASWTWDIVKDQGYWSDNMFRLLGNEPQSYIPKYELFMQAVHPDDRTILEKVLVGIQDPNPDKQINEFESEFRMRKSHGPYITVYSRGEVERDSDGRAMRTTGVMLDVTERREYEKRIRDNEALLETTGQLAKVGGWELSVLPRELTWTTETYRINEVPLDQKPSVASAISFYHPEGQLVLKQALDKAMKLGETFDLELRLTTTTGKERIVRTKGTPVTEQGKIVKLRGTIQDVTDLKQMELELTAINKQLTLQQDLLEQKNIALKEILAHVQDENERTKVQISQNLERLVRPTLKKLRTIIGEHGRTHLDALESTIMEITSPFVAEIERKFINLTPREMEICHHIKNGLRSKEIADILSISVQTVEKFRQKIRKKLGIEGTAANLSSYLRSLRGR